MTFDTTRFSEQLTSLGKQAVLKDKSTDLRTIAAFDCSIHGRKLVCAAAVVDPATMTVVEKKILVKDAPIPYIPGYTAFREGPLILELYYSLEKEPDVLIVDGEGIAHPDGAGLATFVGLELAKPTIGVAKELLGCELSDNDILRNGNIVGRQVRTKEHAKPLFVSPGHLITIERAATLVIESVRPPHKLPEPLHIAHRIADKYCDGIREGRIDPSAPMDAEEPEEIIEEI